MLPGSNIIVSDPKKYQYTKNQIIIILAWRFKKVLLNKYKEKFKGKILNVWPKIRYEKN